MIYACNYTEATMKMNISYRMDSAEQQIILFQGSYKSYIISGSDKVVHV